ncbi:MAG TPA: hemerythrin domain-containing protein, partial [Kofleriaceae bacterium]
MPSDRIGASLILDHADLEADLVELIRAFQIGDWPIARATYTGFERRLTNHFKREEQLLFEDFAREFPKETDELLAEHRLIRRRMDELGFGVDVHQTRLAAIEDLAALLRKHAARED